MNKPKSGDYFEGYIESQKLNPKNGLTWYVTYLNDFNKWKNDKYIKRKNIQPYKIIKPEER